VKSSIFAEFLLKDWEMLSEGSGVEALVLVTPEVADGVGVQVDVAEVGLSNIISNASSGRLRNNKL